MTIDAENYFILESTKEFVKSFKVTLVANYTILRWKSYIESFYIKAKNKIRILLQFFVKNLK